MKKTLTALAFVLTAASASRAQYTGNTLLSDCESDSAYRRGVCDGYISSIADMSITGTNQSWLSFPKGTTFGQVKDVIVKSLKDNPKDRNGSAFVLVFGALQEAFPGPAKMKYGLMKDNDGNMYVVLLIPEPCEPKKSDTN
jgi:Rap1a immunity proteins